MSFFIVMIGPVNDLLKLWCCSQTNWKQTTLPGPSHILLGINTYWTVESFSNRQRLDEKQSCCPPGGEASRVKDRRFITKWDVTEIHYTRNHSCIKTNIRWIKHPVSVIISVHLHLCGQSGLSVMLLVRYECYYCVLSEWPEGEKPESRVLLSSLQYLLPVQRSLLQNT